MEGGRDHYVFWMHAQYIYFLAAQNKQIMFGGGLAPAHQVIKKLKMDHLWVYTLYPNSCRSGYRM